VTIIMSWGSWSIIEYFVKTDYWWKISN